MLNKRYRRLPYTKINSLVKKLNYFLTQPEKICIFVYQNQEKLVHQLLIFIMTS
jgi:hypothetical protein